jgi:hypothetical protein
MRTLRRVPPAPTASIPQRRIDWALCPVSFVQSTALLRDVRHRYLGSLQLFASEKTAGPRSFPHSFLPARRGCRRKWSFRSAK